MENKIDYRDRKKLRGMVPHENWHACKFKLKATGLPTTPKRIGFLLWLDEMNHLFTYDEYTAYWGVNNASLHLTEYEQSGLIYFHPGKAVYLSDVLTSEDGPFICKCCNQVNIDKILKSKGRIQ